jgi:hypothetical protein
MPRSNSVTRSTSPVIKTAPASSDGWRRSITSNRVIEVPVTQHGALQGAEGVINHHGDRDLVGLGQRHRVNGRPLRGAGRRPRRPRRVPMITAHGPDSTAHRSRAKVPG